MSYGERLKCLGWGDRIDESDHWLVDLRKCPISNQRRQLMAYSRSGKGRGKQDMRDDSRDQKCSPLRLNTASLWALDLDSWSHSSGPCPSPSATFSSPYLALAPALDLALCDE